MQPLVNHNHKEKSWEVLAKSGNLYLHLDDNLVKLSDWLKTRADMPDSVAEVFSPENDEWQENIAYINSKEALYCLYDGKWWTVEETEQGIMGELAEPHFLVPMLIKREIAGRTKADLITMRDELEDELAKELLKGDRYYQELHLIKETIVSLNK